MKYIFRNILENNFITIINKWLIKGPAVQQEEESKDFLQRKVFYATFIRAGDLCFDVGANIGNRVAPLLSIGAKVVAVEPQEYCYTTLRNKFGNKIEIVTKGLGEKEEIKDFYIASAHTISTFSTDFVDAVKDGRFKEYNWNKSVKVEMTTLDALIAKYEVPAFIKIDVEGYELEVLKGLSSSIPMISFEYMVPEQTQKVVDCISQIQKNTAAIECNYSIGESMEFALESWLSADEMKAYVMSSDFISTEFGDVYCRMKK